MLSLKPNENIYSDALCTLLFFSLSLFIMADMYVLLCPLTFFFFFFFFLFLSVLDAFMTFE